MWPVSFRRTLSLHIIIELVLVDALKSLFYYHNCFICSLHLGRKTTAKKGSMPSITELSSLEDSDKVENVSMVR